VRDRSSPNPALVGNRLLAALQRECRALRGLAESQWYPVGHELQVPGRPVHHVYFPTSAISSTLVYLQDGATAESSLCGSDGVVGLSVWLGLKEGLERVMIQVAGEVQRVPVRAFCAALEGHQRATRVLKRYTAYTIRFGSQTAVCTAHHDVEQRACRWLLTMADVSVTPHVELTQSLLAHMLGVRRQSIGRIAVRLQSQGLIRYRRGDVQLVDRRAVERHACECYREMRTLYDELVGPELMSSPSSSDT
jgi:CRP-like cAMP-binding protein